ncbi:MAG: class I SAM-dependent methyltransferase [Bdellovibrionaceae bacterium]|nr:class I SAM-dependent methyltransferase [Bdellovibrionales bacterium]MCB9083313.1 class I SAM-dependent methyltransferase [Pseudobdellovibrionaceae bacterium]
MAQHWREIKALRGKARGLHRTFADEPITWEILEEVVDFLLTKLRPKMKTMETGAGLSSVLFAEKQTEHLAITPSAVERERILKVCRDEKIGIAKLEFLLDRSENVLPRLSDNYRFDLVLIDGGHGFPTPFIDWYYASRHLNTGGYLIIDDINLWTGYTLYRFLNRHPHWQKVANFSWQAAVFRKINPAAGWEFEDWYHQPWLERLYPPAPLVRMTWAPLTGNTVWQKRLWRWLCDQMFRMTILHFFHHLIRRPILLVYTYAIKKVYLHTLHKLYLHVIREAFIQLNRLAFILLPSWGVKAYTYGRTLVWSINLPEWPGILRMWFWKCVPLWVRRENLRRMWNKRSGAQS